MGLGREQQQQVHLARAVAILLLLLIGNNRYTSKHVRVFISRLLLLLFPILELLLLLGQIFHVLFRRRFFRRHLPLILVRTHFVYR